MAADLMEYFNRQPRLGVMSTSSRDGLVDCAVLGSPQMIDVKTVMVALSRGRTFTNLSENPNAVYTIIQQGAGIMDWKGVRVYLRMRDHVTSGPQLDEYKSQMADRVGRQAADMIGVLAWFDITEVRPLIDFGQGWERSV